MNKDLPSTLDIYKHVHEEVDTEDSDKSKNLYLPAENENGPPIFFEKDQYPIIGPIEFVTKAIPTQVRKCLLLHERVCKCLVLRVSLYSLTKSKKSLMEILLTPKN